MGVNPSNSGLKSTAFSWECHEKFKKHCAGASLLTNVWECCSKTRLLTKSCIKVHFLAVSVMKNNKKHCARTLHLIKVTECCSKPRMFTESGFESSTMGKTCCTMGKAFYSMGKTFPTSLLTMIQNEMQS